MRYFAVFCRTSFTGDEARAVFRYWDDAESYAKAKAGRKDYREVGYAVEEVEIDIRESEEQRT